jgi:hypothetical protein
MDRSDVLGGENGSLDIYVLNFYTLEPSSGKILRKSRTAVCQTQRISGPGQSVEALGRKITKAAGHYLRLNVQSDLIRLKRLDSRAIVPH